MKVQKKLVCDFKAQSSYCKQIFRFVQKFYKKKPTKQYNRFFMIRSQKIRNVWYRLSGFILRFLVIKRNRNRDQHRWKLVRRYVNSSFLTIRRYICQPKKNDQMNRIRSLCSRCLSIKIKAVVLFGRNSILMDL